DFPAFADRGRERCSARSLVWRTRGHCCGHLAHRGSGPLLCASLTKETGMATRRTTESPQGDASPKKRAPRKRATRSEQVDAPVTEAGSEVAGEARVAAPGAEAERATEAGTAAHTGGASGVSWEVRHAMIAEAAYL